MAINIPPKVYWIAGGIFVLFMIFSGHLNLGLNISLQSILGTETMTRSLSAVSVEPGTPVTATWTLVGASGAYGVLIDDNITGGCTLTDGTTRLSSIMTNPDTTKTLTINTPASPTNCTFTGTYSLGNVTQKNLNTQVVNVACIPISPADLNCDKHIVKSELLNYLQKYIDGAVSKTQLLNTLQIWIDGGGQ